MTKKYIVIAKVGNDKFIKHHVSNLLLYTNYLDKNWSDWRWFNVFDKKTKEQITSFTKNRRPNKSFV